MCCSNGKMEWKSQISHKISSKLSKTQRNYSVTELEAWAVVATCRKFRKYLEAADRVVVISDHNFLQWMRTQPDPRGKFSRWIME